MIKHILVILFFTANLHATCPLEVQVIEKDQKANCTGFLFSPEAENNVSMKLNELKYHKTLNSLLEQKTELQQRELDLLYKKQKNYMEQNEILSRQINNRETISFWKKTLYFSLGIIVTGLAVNGASKLQR